MAQNKIPSTVRMMIWGAILLLVVPLSAQEKQPPQIQTHDSTLRRVLFSDYTTPTVRLIQVRGESLLASMIQNGKLEISDEDAVRLALANNVDINVQRYVPYSALWGVEAGRAVLDPTVTFSPGINRVVTPASSALQGEFLRAQPVQPLQHGRAQAVRAGPGP